MKKLAIVLCNDMHMDIANADTLLRYIKQNEAYEVVCDYTIADIVIVITCAFGPHKMYSMRVISDVRINSKQDSEVIVTGCLLKLNKEELEAIPGISVKGFDELLNQFKVSPQETKSILPQNKVIISQGCLHRCSYCVYPMLVNKYKSKPIEDILKEVEVLYETESTIYITGAQETSDYGVDLYGKRSFAELLGKIVEQFPDSNYVIGWFHPAGLTDEVISVISENPNIVEIMLHIQHVDENILKNMNRISFAEVDEKICKLKKLRPDLFISTEVIVGFPGETEKEFADLVQYLSKGYFDDIGVASYEPVLGTKAATLPNQVSSKLKAERMKFIKDNFCATCYPADESSNESVIEEYIKAYTVLTNMPKNILKDRQKYNCIAGVDTSAKLENFKKHLNEVIEAIQASRTEYDFQKNRKLLHEKYTTQALKLFYDVIVKCGFKEALIKRAQELLLSD